MTPGPPRSGWSGRSPAADVSACTRARAPAESLPRSGRSSWPGGGLPAMRFRESGRLDTSSVQDRRGSRGGGGRGLAVGGGGLGLVGLVVVVLVQVLGGGGGDTSSLAGVLNGLGSG